MNSQDTKKGKKTRKFHSKVDSLLRNVNSFRLSLVTDVRQRVKRNMRVLFALCTALGLLMTSACGDNIDPKAANNKSVNNQFVGEFQGAGSSAQLAAMEAWIAGYQETYRRVNIAYNPTGSGAGVATFLTGATVWASSDVPLSEKQLTQSMQVCSNGENAFQFPVIAIPLAIMFNLRADGKQIKNINMDAKTVSEIFDGKVEYWDDPRIAGFNKEEKLPHTRITVVHRSDKSGTTKNFTEFLSQASEGAWKYKVGENWPNNVGQGARGTDGVVNTIGQANGTIGYADQEKSVNYGTVSLKTGDTFTPFSPAAAASFVYSMKSDKSAEDKGSYVFKPDYAHAEKGQYPLVMLSYVAACSAHKHESDQHFLKTWFHYLVTESAQKYAAENAGTVPLPKQLLEKFQNFIGQLS